MTPLGTAWDALPPGNPFTTAWTAAAFASGAAPYRIAQQVLGAVWDGWSRALPPLGQIDEIGAFHQEVSLADFQAVLAALDHIRAARASAH